MKKGSEKRNSDALLKPFARSRNLSILIFIAIVLVSLVFFRNRMAPSVYIAPRDEALELSCYDDRLLSIPYETIQAIGQRDGLDCGVLVDGIDDKKARCGTWHSEELGDYALYAQKSLSHYVILRTAERYVAFNYESDAVTDSIFQALCELLDQKGVAYEIA